MAQTSGGIQPVSPTSPALGPERQVRELLAQGKWRKARDEAKLLVKQDRARFLPLLVEANQGLAREMIAKGLVSEARQVLAYLATLVPTAQLRGLELELEARSGGTPDSTVRFAAALADPAAALSEAERMKLADQLVVGFTPLPGDSPALERLAAERRAIQEALQSLSERQWTRVQELLRPLSRHSPFSHWTLFIKGLAAFHTGDRERAGRFFESLPAGSVPAKASGLYAWICRGAEPAGVTPAWREALVGGLCRLAGASAMAGLLGRAERLWREGNHAESYRVWRQGVAAFPTEGPDWLGALSRFYFQSVHAMAGDAQDDYLNAFCDLLGYDNAKNMVEEMLGRRMLALQGAQVDSGEGLRGNWEDFLRARQRLHKANPRLESIAYGWLGEQLSRVRPDPLGFGGPRRRPPLRDASGAKECLLKALDLDPGNLEASLQLALVYRALNNKTQLNRLLDEMARRFPEEKRVLLETARNCLERKATVKGLNCLERARQLDRLDPQIADLLASTRRQLARQHFAKGQPEKGRQALEPLEELLTDDLDDFQRGRWQARLRRGLLEQFHGDASQGAALLEQARAANPFPVVFLLAAHVIHRLYKGGGAKDSPFLIELRAELKRQPDAAHALPLLRLFLSIDKTADKPPLGAELKMVREYLSAAAKGPCARALARQIVELCGPDQFKKQAQAYIQRMLREDPRDPWFRFFNFQQTFSAFNPPGKSRKTLESILQEAQRRGDHELIQKIQGLIRRLDQPPPPPPMPLMPDFEDSDEEEGDFPPLPFEPPGGLPHLNPKEMAEMAEMLEMMRKLPEAELRRARKTVFKGVPDFIFEILLEAAKNPDGIPNLPFPPPGPRGPRRRPRGDASQLDLF